METKLFHENIIISNRWIKNCNSVVICELYRWDQENPRKLTIHQLYNAFKKTKTDFRHYRHIPAVTS